MYQTTVLGFFSYIAVLQGYSEMYVLITFKNAFKELKLLIKSKQVKY